MVTGLLGYSVDYDVTIETLPANACTNDGFEGLLGNNELDRAFPIDQGTYQHNVCGDEDWFSIDLIAGLDLKVDAIPEVALDNLDMTIVSQAGAVLATGQPNFVGADATGDMTATYSTVSDGTYYIRLKRSDNAAEANVPNRLVVSSELSANAGQLACTNPPAINVGGAVNLVSQSNVIRLPTSCGAGAGETFVLSVNVGAPTVVDIALSDPSLTTSAISVRTLLCRCASKSRARF